SRIGRNNEYKPIKYEVPNDLDENLKKFVENNSIKWISYNDLIATVYFAELTFYLLVIYKNQL
ncbi:12518_t:CDS:1, partial [Racocetra fulgida]